MAKKFVVISAMAENLVNLRGALLTSLVSHGHKVIGCGPAASPVMIKKLNLMGVEYREIPFSRIGLSPIKDLQMVCFLVRMLAREKPEIVMNYNIKPVIYGSIAARLAGVPFIYSMITGLGYVFTSKGLRVELVDSIVSLLYRVSLRINRKVFFQNPDDQDVFLRRKFISDEKKCVIVNGSGVDLNEYPNSPVAEANSFLMITRMITDKGLIEYVDAAKIIKKRFPHVRFYLAGWFDSSPPSIKKSDLDGWVESGVINYLGYLEDVRPAIQNSSVFVLPSYREGTPRTVLEAMSIGRAIITTDAPGCRETVKDGENGYLVPIRDVDSLVVAMEKFVDNAELVAKMGKRSREIAIEKYDVKKVNSVILQTMGML